MAGTASVLVDGRCIGTYPVRNLSASGALLGDGPALPVGTACHVRLRLARLLKVEMDACVVRTERPGAPPSKGFAVMFRNVAPAVQEVLQRRVAEALELAAQPAVLIIYPSSRALVELAGYSIRLGHHPVLVRTRLAAIYQTYALDVPLFAALVGSSLQSTAAGELVAFFHEQRPRVRCLLVHDAGMSNAQCLATGSPFDGTLRRPWNERRLGALLSGELAAHPGMDPEPPEPARSDAAVSRASDRSSRSSLSPWSLSP